MKEYQIEETIISYFDGRLDDHESAELLHRVSVSPEIRQLFNEHKTIRQMASLASRNVTVRPEIEDALFAHIASLQEAERAGAMLTTEPTIPVVQSMADAPAAGFWSIRKYVSAAALFGLLIVASTEYALSPTTDSDKSHDRSQVVHAPQSRNGNVAQTTAALAAADAPQFAADGNQLAADGNQLAADRQQPTVSGAQLVTEGGASDRVINSAETGNIASSDSPSGLSRTKNSLASSTESQAANRVYAPGGSRQRLHVVSVNGLSTSGSFSALDRNGAHSRTMDAHSIAPSPTVSTNESALASNEIISLHPASYLSNDGIRPTHIGEPTHQTLSSLVAVSTQDAGHYEVGMETSNGFSLPASAIQVAPFANNRIHFAYYFDESNQAGLRLTYGLFQTLHEDAAAGVGYTSITRTISADRQLAGEIFLAHREPIAGGQFFIEGGLSAGLLQQGNLVSAELGIRIPVSNHIILGTSFTLSRVHSNAATNDQLMLQTAGPVILEGSDIHNTLNGHLQYGLSYRF